MKKLLLLRLPKPDNQESLNNMEKWCEVLDEKCQYSDTIPVFIPHGIEIITKLNELEIKEIEDLVTQHLIKIGKI